MLSSARAVQNLPSVERKSWPIACQASCEDHWGDCNSDYRDGCEAPTKHPRFCDGSPLIELSTRASILTYAKERKGPGLFDPLAFELSLSLHKAELQACYEQALAGMPSLEGVMTYQLTLNDATGCLEPKLTRNELSNAALEACLVKVFADVTFDSPPRGGSATFDYQLIFTPPDS